MRVFIGIKTSPFLQAEIATWQRRHHDLRVRWIEPEHLHMTIVPPWEEHDVDSVIRDLKDAAYRQKGFDIDFTSVSVGPTETRQNLIWASGETAPEMTSLVQKMRGQFGGEGLRFTPHITIARFKGWIQMPTESVGWQERCDNVSLFISHGRSEYSVLSSVDLD